MARRAFRTATDAGTGGISAPGLYSALLEQRRASYARNRVDPRCHYSERCAHGDNDAPAECLLPPSAVLKALEAGQSVTLQGRDLRGVSLPSVPLRRDRAFEWFVVTPDDRIVRG